MNQLKKMIEKVESLNSTNNGKRESGQEFITVMIAALPHIKAQFSNNENSEKFYYAKKYVRDKIGLDVSYHEEIFINIMKKNGFFTEFHYMMIELVLSFTIAISFWFIFQQYYILSMIQSIITICTVLFVYLIIDPIATINFYR